MGGGSLMTPCPGLPNKRWVKQHHVKLVGSGWSNRQLAHLLVFFPPAYLGIVLGVFQAVDAIQCFDFVVYQPVASLFGSVKTSLNNQSVYAVLRINDLISLFFDHKNEIFLHGLMPTDHKIKQFAQSVNQSVNNYDNIVVWSCDLLHLKISILMLLLSLYMIPPQSSSYLF